MRRRNKISHIFKREQANRPPVTGLMSFTRKWLYALALTGLSLPFANSAFALSAGCAGWNTSATSDGIVASNQAFSAWEVAKVTFKHVGGTSPNNYTYTYTDNINAANSRAATAGSTSIGETVTLTIQIPADTTNAKLIMYGPTASYNLTVTCVAGSPPAEKSTSAASTSSAVVGAVSRSQTTVIQQNIKSRTSSIISPANTSQIGNVPNETISSGTPGTNNASLIDNLADDDRNTITTRNNVLRRLAMTGDFDSSRMAANGFGTSALGLGPTDRGDVGGAGGIDGRSALQNTSPFTVWGHGSFTSVENDFVSGSTDSRYNGDVWGYNIGLDYKFAETLTAGLSLGYNDTDLTTSFNDGSYQEKGWVASPYAIYRPIANLTLVGEAGFGLGDIDVARNNDAVSGKTESDMWFAAINASYVIHPVETLTAVSLTPSLAFIAAHKTVDAYTESDGTAVSKTTANTRQINPAIEAAYGFAPTQSLTVTPFLETGLIYDFTDEINNDKTAFNIGGGVRLSESTTGLNAALEGNYLAGRTDYTEYTLSGTVTYGFALMGDDGQEMGIVKPFVACNLNEYGNQRVRTGFGFDTGPLTSELALSHMMSVANDEDDSNSSAIEISMSLPF
ncbi:autotransporter outer membrane beta-barrel domain-containing protein [Thalassospira alkalitolerans]|uniref:autotransporter outer membrane beta-barrel domain-containing protein n=1 Tax=Thalassospira alkalitolerans TaxID=1293890 RepID=UPI003AA8E24E